MCLNELEKYMEYLFAAALKKSGSLNDAEDLTQEVLLAALQYPKEIIDMKAWLSKVLNNKFYDMLRAKYKLPTISIDYIPDEEGLFDECQDDSRPDAIAIRKELAYLADKYRNVIVRHYFLGQKVQEIADDLKIPKGTVLSRLSNGRKQMKKGFDEMEDYQKHSYQPEKLELSCNGRSGFKDEPWSLVANDLMKQNILIIAYEKPITLVEIARALGIPTAYIENAANDLCAKELMRKIGNRYFTDFMIKTPAQLLKGLDAEIALVEAHYSQLMQNINEFLIKLRTPLFLSTIADNKVKKLEYYFILHLFSSAIYTAIQGLVPSIEEYPQRPDGGEWIAIGSRYPQDFDCDNYRMAKYSYGGERRVKWTNFLNSKSIHLRIYDTQPDLNKYQKGPAHIQDDNLAKLLYIISRGIPFESTGFDLIYLKDIPHLRECGILATEEGKPIVNIPIISPDEYLELDQMRIEQMYELAEILKPLIKDILPHVKIEIPSHLEGRIAEFRKYSCYSIPMAFVKKAIDLGDYSFENASPPMVFVVDEKTK